MKPELILLRDIAIETWQVQGLVAQAQVREDLIIILKFLRESKNSTAEDTAKELAKHILFDDKGRLVVAERLLKITELYHLTKRFENGRYALNERGFNALEKKKVFVPKYGSWKLSVSDDSLLPHKVIDIKKFHDSDAVSESMGKGAKSKLKERKLNMKPLPDWIKGCAKTETRPHAGGEEIRIDSIESKAEEVEPQFSLTVKWNVSSGKVELLGGKGKTLNSFKGPKISQDDIWKILLKRKGWLNDWDDAKSNLAIKFAEVDDDASKKLMVADFEFAVRDIQNYGDFNDIVVEGVALRAASESDAKQWADWRLNQSIDSIATAKKYEGWVREALSPFAEFNIPSPERAKHALALWNEAKDAKTRRVAWCMIAATDWEL